MVELPPPPSPQWFKDARFGMFVHWGLYSILGRGEWVRNRERIADQEYEALSDSFITESYDPVEWAELAKKAGMRYGVLTTKHHEGFCLWNSQTCAFNSINSACKRDLVGEFVTAFRSAGLGVGLYYSLGDWHNPDWAKAVLGDSEARVRFVDYSHSLVKELVTQYGKIDIMWYDLPQGMTAEQWKSAELNAMIRGHQPNILINNRSFLPEDFSVLEQTLHGPPVGRTWESCMTLNESWGYVPSDTSTKDAKAVAKTLAKTVGAGGNLLLNVGPKPSGEIAEHHKAVLLEVGEWLDRNGEALYGANGGGLPFNLWGASTVKGNCMYLFLERYIGNEFVVGGLTGKVLSASILGTDQLLSVRQQGPQTFVSGLPDSSPDPVLTVVKLICDGPPDQDLSRVIGGADIMATFPD